ncbi:hypothetical protein [Helicobacter sp. MIT 14-3879]|nr:hypothetical protein [Helicobacter sp. MIT 14-3879]
MRDISLTLNKTTALVILNFAKQSEESIESLLLDSNKLKNLKALIKFSN